jgi:hypothetical protein
MSRRRIIATLMRGTEKRVIWVRRYSYFDTAMPRVVQLALRDSEAGDIVELASVDLGFQLGILQVQARGRFDLQMSALVKASPSLMKLMTEEV